VVREAGAGGETKISSSKKSSEEPAWDGFRVKKSYIIHAVLRASLKSTSN